MRDFFETTLKPKSWIELIAIIVIGALLSWGFDLSEMQEIGFFMGVILLKVFQAAER